MKIYSWLKCKRMIIFNFNRITISNKKMSFKWNNKYKLNNKDR